MRTAVVIGASGGIGRALVGRLNQGGAYDRLVALSRTPLRDAATGVVTGHIDLGDEMSIRAAAETVGEADLVLVATGVLQSGALRPERSYRAINPEAMLESYRVNAIGPALVARAFLPTLPIHRRSVFAALSARVGSITENKLGGWHSYRASKAALNMLICNFAIELARERPQAICVALHPGTVDTALSAPFQRNLPAQQIQSPGDAAGQLLRVVDGLTPADSGGLFAWDGQRIAP